jgi:hypothetical protein
VASDGEATPPLADTTTMGEERSLDVRSAAYEGRTLRLPRHVAQSANAPIDRRVPRDPAGQVGLRDEAGDYVVRPGGVVAEGAALRGELRAVGAPSGVPARQVPCDKAHGDEQAYDLAVLATSRAPRTAKK